MDSVFFTQFLIISNIKTVIFLFALICVFILIHYLYHKKHVDFSILVIIGTFLGLVLGIIVQITAGFPDNPMETIFVREVINWYALFGNGFIDLIKMLVVPLVMVSMMQVIINMQQGQSMGRLVKITVFITMSMVAVSAIVGIAVGLLFKIGAGSSIVSDTTTQAKEIVSVASTLRGLIPSNIVSAMVDNSIIGLVIFSAIFGLAVWWVNYENAELAKPLYSLINGLHKAMVNMALLILDYMPYAVVALLANTIAQRGLTSIIDVGKFIIALYIAVAIQFVIQLGFLAINGINPIYYIKKSFATMLLAFTSRSSVGCLPMTIETLTKKLGVDQGTASFVAGFGTTAGMQGCAGVFPALLIIYVSNITNTPIDFTLLVMTVIVITIGSLGIAGIPGTATMAASVGLSGVGMASSFFMVSPILAVDPIIDMPRTMLNVTGSITNSLIVDKKIGTFNIDNYSNMKLDLKDIKIKDKE